jgi:hypothetical protein
MPGEGTPPAKPDEAVKVQSGEQVFYVLFSEGGNEIAETWFDPWGTFVAYFKTRIERAPAAGAPWRIRSQEGAHFRRDYYSETGGDLSRYAGDDGDFSIFYSARCLPLFWTSTPGTAAGGTGILPETGIFSFQWDEQGQLVRLRDLSPAGPDTGEGIVISPGAAPAGDAAEADVEPPPVPVDFRYEYEFDARGNWVLRREIALYRRDGLLLPAYSREISRRIIQEE